MNSGTFQVNLTPEKGGVVVKISGTLDETANLGSINLKTYKEIILDLSGLARINSHGIRSWLTWLNHFDQGRQVTVSHCPKILITQANTIKGLLPAWMHLKQLAVPYFCAECNEDFSKWIEVSSSIENL